MYDRLARKTYRLLAEVTPNPTPAMVDQYVRAAAHPLFDRPTTAEERRTLSEESIFFSIERLIHQKLMGFLTPGRPSETSKNIAQALGSDVYRQATSVMYEPTLPTSVVVPDVARYNPIALPSGGVSIYTQYVLLNWIARTSAAAIQIVHPTQEGEFPPHDRDLLRGAAAEDALVVVPYIFSNHVNMLFVDFAKNVVEHFEPHGAELGGYDNDVIVSSAVAIVQTIGRTVGRGLEYAPPYEVCPGEGPQMKETRFSGGYCAFWGIYLFHLRVLNPGASLPSLVDYMVSFPDLLREITRYRCYLISNLNTIDVTGYPAEVQNDVADELGASGRYIQSCL